jgi:hypothetical protein
VRLRDRSECLPDADLIAAIQEDERTFLDTGTIRCFLVNSTTDGTGADSNRRKCENLGWERGRAC